MMNLLRKFWSSSNLKKKTNLLFISFSLKFNGYINSKKVVSFYSYYPYSLSKFILLTPFRIPPFLYKNKAEPKFNLIFWLSWRRLFYVIITTSLIKHKYEIIVASTLRAKNAPLEHFINAPFESRLFYIKIRLNQSSTLFFG
jgi:hypothetical protein